MARRTDQQAGRSGGRPVPASGLPHRPCRQGRRPPGDSLPLPPRKRTSTMIPRAVGRRLAGKHVTWSRARRYRPRASCTRRGWRVPSSGPEKMDLRAPMDTLRRRWDSLVGGRRPPVESPPTSGRSPPPRCSRDAGPKPSQMQHRARRSDNSLFLIEGRLAAARLFGANSRLFVASITSLYFPN